MEKEIVSNTSSIIFIGKLEILNLVKNLYDKILIPKEVMKEIFEYDKPENVYLQGEIGKFIKEVDIKEIKEFPIDVGERAAISLCLKNNFYTFLSDDKKARKYARALKIKTIGVLGIILENLKKEKISKQEAKRLIKAIIEKGYFMTARLYHEVIEVIEG